MLSDFKFYVCFRILCYFAFFPQMMLFILINCCCCYVFFHFVWPYFLFKFLMFVLIVLMLSDFGFVSLEKMLIFRV